MAINSIEIPIGTIMPKFELKDPDGKSYKSDTLAGSRGLLVIFTCNHCPYAKAVWPRTIRIAESAKALGISTVAINPNLHPDYPEDAPEVMKQKMKEWGILFPYLIDQAQEVAASFKAQCTPDIYLFDKTKKLVYHGRVDDNWQDEKSVTREELKAAVKNLAEGKSIDSTQYPSLGCSIKWRKNPYN